MSAYPGCVLYYQEGQINTAIGGTDKSKLSYCRRLGKGMYVTRKKITLPMAQGTDCRWKHIKVMYKKGISINVGDFAWLCSTVHSGNSHVPCPLCLHLHFTFRGFFISFPQNCSTFIAGTYLLTICLTYPCEPLPQ